MMRLRLTFRHQLVLTIAMLLLMSSVLGWAQTRQHYYKYLSDIHAISQLRSSSFIVTFDHIDSRKATAIQQVEQLLERGFDALNLWQFDPAVRYWEQFFSGPARDAILQDNCGAAKYVIAGHFDVEFLQDDLSLAILRGQIDVLTDGGTARIDRHTVRVVIEQTELGMAISQIDDQSQVPLPRQPRAAVTSSFDGFNYYPAATPWSLFWPNFNPEVTQLDFAGMKSLGAKAVRVFLTEAAFYGDDTAANLRALEQLLDIAASQDLGVVVTLFDLKTGYGLDNLRRDLASLDRILFVLNSTPAQVLIDLKNEPDLDYDAHPETRRWLSAIAAFAGEKTALPLTIGWSEAVHAGEFADQLDVISYHEYDQIEGTNSRFQAVVDAADGKPVIVSEIGAASANLWMGFPSSTGKQGDLLRQRLDALQGANGVMIWTYNDFTEVDTHALGRSPWVHFLQSTYGIIDIDRNEKPSASIVSEYWAGIAPEPNPRAQADTLIQRNTRPHQSEETD